MLHAGEMLGTQCNTPGVPQPHSTNETSINSLLPFYEMQIILTSEKVSKRPDCFCFDLKMFMFSKLDKDNNDFFLFRQYIMYQCLIVESNPYSLL